MLIIMKKITSIQNPKLLEATQNAEKFINQMKKMDDKKLVKHLKLFRMQMEIARETKNHKAFELLCEYERQVIEARVAKLDKK